jgi:hypothetical protein
MLVLVVRQDRHHGRDFDFQFLTGERTRLRVLATAPRGRELPYKFALARQKEAFSWRLTSDLRYPAFHSRTTKGIAQDLLRRGYGAPEGAHSADVRLLTSDIRLRPPHDYRRDGASCPNSNCIWMHRSSDRCVTRNRHCRSKATPRWAENA